MTVSELAHFTVKPGTDLQSGDGKATLEHVLETISKQAGCLNVSYGATVENPEDFDMIVGMTIHSLLDLAILYIQMTDPC
jgi:hypothetical protein